MIAAKYDGSFSEQNGVSVGAGMLNTDVDFLCVMCYMQPEEMEGCITMSSNEANWVRERAQCTIKGSFEVIAKAVEQNITTFNSCNNEERHDRLFVYKRYDNKSLEVYSAVEGYDKDGKKIRFEKGGDNRNYVVLISCSDTSIVVDRRDLPDIEICPKWNKKTLTCDFLIEGKAYSASCISHMILCDILFDNQDQ